MNRLLRRVLVASLIVAAVPMLAAQSQPAAAPAAAPPTTFSVKHVIGMPQIAHNASGKLTAQGSTLTFEAGKVKSEVPIASIEDVAIGNDSKRVFGGPIGTLTMFGPYGSGRFLSLFRSKTDVLTVSYRDENGALHGAIFTFDWGKGLEAKKQLVALGAKAAVSVEDNIKARSKEKTGETKPKGGEEKQQ